MYSKMSTFSQTKNDRWNIQNNHQQTKRREIKKNN